MALSEFEIKRIEKSATAFIERRRPPAHLRDQLDLGFRISGQSLELFEVRPYWRDPAEKIEQMVAKTTYKKTTKTWAIYWQRADLKWHRYQPDPEVDSLEQFLKIVDADEHGAFFG